MILEKPAGLRHGAIRDGKDGNAQVGHGVEELKGHLRELQGRLPFEFPRRATMLVE